MLLISVLVVRRSLNLRYKKGFSKKRTNDIMSQLDGHHLDGLIIHRVDRVRRLRTPLAIRTLLRVRNFTTLKDIVVRLITKVHNGPISNGRAQINGPNLERLLD